MKRTSLDPASFTFLTGETRYDTEVFGSNVDCRVDLYATDDCDVALVTDQGVIPYWSGKIGHFDVRCAGLMRVELRTKKTCRLAWKVQYRSLSDDGADYQPVEIIPPSHNQLFLREMINRAVAARMGHAPEDLDLSSEDELDFEEDDDEYEPISPYEDRSEELVWFDGAELPVSEVPAVERETTQKAGAGDEQPGGEGGETPPSVSPSSGKADESTER